MASDNRQTRHLTRFSPPNYYEELGLSRHASPEEIRRTYRNLAWLLHPDRCQDDDMRRVAEAQLKRLNAIVAVLLDPEQRRRYDESLERSEGSWLWKIRALQVRLAALSATRPRSWVWAGGGLLLLGLLTWLVVAKPSRAARSLSSATPHVQRDLAENRAVPAKLQPAPAALPLASAPQRTTNSKKLPQLAPPQPEADNIQTTLELPRSESPAPHAESASEQASPPAPSIAEAAPSTPRPAEGGPARDCSARTYSGWWVLVPGKATEMPAELYPPIYVEMFIEQKGAVLRGRYKGRYQVTDRAISPEVSFTFEGRAQGDEPELTWRGAQGAEGRLRLRWVGENSMEVRWWTTNFGTELGLSSGIATLIRVEERR